MKIDVFQVLTAGVAVYGALLSTVAFLAAVGAFAANYFSGVHRWIAP